jgi:hypothetical protein
MKKGINKFAKGVFAIFTIKLLFFGIVFLNQACQNEDTIELSQEQALANFEQKLELIKPKINSILERNNYLLKNSIQAKNTNVQLKKEITNAMSPLVDSSIKLFKTFDYNTNDISNTFGNQTDSRIALLGILVYSAEKAEINQSLAYNNTFNFFGEKMYATTSYAHGMPEWVKCAIEAIGFDIFISAGSYGWKKAMKKGWKKALVKIGSRFLGPIGVASAVAEFSWCMYTS